VEHADESTSGKTSKLEVLLRVFESRATHRVKQFGTGRGYLKHGTWPGRTGPRSDTRWAAVGRKPCVAPCPGRRPPLRPGSSRARVGPAPDRQRSPRPSPGPPRQPFPEKGPTGPGPERAVGPLPREGPRDLPPPTPRARLAMLPITPPP